MTQHTRSPLAQGAAVISQRIGLDTAYVGFLPEEVLVTFAGISTSRSYDVAATRLIFALLEQVNGPQVTYSSSLTGSNIFNNRNYLEALQKVIVGISPATARELAARLSARITHNADLTDPSIGVLT